MTALSMFAIHAQLTCVFTNSINCAVKESWKMNIYLKMVTVV